MGDVERMVLKCLSLMLVYFRFHIYRVESFERKIPFSLLRGVAVGSSLPREMETQGI